METSSLHRLPPIAIVQHHKPVDDGAPQPSTQNTSYISPPVSRRVSDEEEAGSIMAQVSRQSLPSIHEALASQQPPALPGASSSAEFPPPRFYTTGPERRSQDHNQPPLSPRSNSSSQVASGGPPTAPHYAPSHPSHRPTLPEPGYPSATSGGAPRLPSLQPHSDAATPPSPHAYPSSHRDSFSAARHVLPPPLPRHDSSYPPTTHEYPSPHHYTSPTAGSNPQSAYPPRSRYPEESKYPQPTYSLYGNSVKRHLDIYEVDSVINEIHKSSARGVDFSNRYAQLAHRSAKTGMASHMMPSFAEIDEMLQFNEAARQSLHRLRHMTHAQMEMAEHSREQAKISHATAAREEAEAYPEDTKEASFGPADKKRRGRTALPGRCHSCNRLETPEWRRGPDGARTLCNACGLHWAKLKRKQESKNAVLDSQQSSSSGV